MKIYDNNFIIENICYVAKSESGKKSYATQNRQTDSFVYILSGSTEYSDSSNHFIASKGNVIYLSRNSNYKIKILDNNYSFIVINFLLKDSIYKKIDNELFIINSPNELDVKFIKINNIWPIETTENRLKAMSILYEIYSLLCKYSINKYLPTESKNKIQNISEYILNNCFNENLCISSIVKKYDISEAQFRRLFKQVYSCSPIKFIQNVRINKAKQLLSDETLSIKTIAQTCGYEDEFYFSRIFKKVTGMTATSYRKNSQKYYKQ